MRDKRKIIALLGILSFVLMIGGISYGYFVYNKDIPLSFEAGEISIDFQNNSNSYSNLTIIPDNDEMGKKSNNYIDFTINGRVDIETIKYELEIIPTSGSTMNTDYIKVYLTDQEDNMIVSPYLYSELINSERNNGKSLYQKLIEPANNGESRNVSNDYRLRIWIDENYGESSGKVFNFEIKLYAYNIDTIKYAKVILDTQDGRSGLVKYALSGSTFDFLPQIARDDYTFDGWSVESTDTIPASTDYRYMGDYTFTGTNYINTGVSLFSEDNWDKNFYISFEIKNYINGESQATFIGSKDESTNNYPGFVVRKSSSSNNLNISANVNSSNKNDITNLAPILETEKVELLRINKVLYYSFDGGEFTQAFDFDGFSLYFDLPVTIGAAFKSDGVTLQRYLRGTLSNMLITFLDDNATTSNYENHFKPLIGNTTINISSNWHKNIIFDKVTDVDIKSIDYIASYDDVINNNPTYTTQDTAKTNMNKKTVYYYTGSEAAEHSNVLFAGFCWQIIRTTDTGSVKMIYNGIAENDKCKTDRDYSELKSVNRSGYQQQKTLTGNRLYGKSYDYDLNAGTFTIKDTDGLPSEWSENDSNNNGKVDWQELIGTYTCDNTNTTCSNLFYIGHYQNATQASSVNYTIGALRHYSEIGTSQFRSSYRSPALVGYMFNAASDWLTDLKEGTYVSDVTWNSNENKYVVSNSTSETPDNNHHYICEDSDCTKVKFYYYANDNAYRYILLSNGETVESALNKMINSEGDVTININVYNSTIKGYLDNWYKKNLSNFTKYLDTNIVYCNNRRTTSINGWDKQGDLTIGESIRFYNYIFSNIDLSCANITDRFSINNTLAPLIYPVGLLTSPEAGLMGTSYASTGNNYWLLSPTKFHIYSGYGALLAVVYSNGGGAGDSPTTNGVRPVIALKSDVRVISGDGGYETPYKIDTSS